ncbi:MAG: (d)CMP kinase [SAR202 cluster bacterium]|nr:(d)CMP kinase [SAR202 cluster bacterium]
MDGFGTRRPIVAVDGPAGAGKSTVARLLARELYYAYLDSGAMYRSVALLAQRSGLGWDEEAALGELAGALAFQFPPCAARSRILVNDEDVSDLIRTPEISLGASQVAQWPAVRAALVREQQRLGKAGGVVMEGRDIGTVVFPDAEVKIYLTASLAERARRRTQELTERGERVDAARVRQDVAERDRQDTLRTHSPLRRAPDALEFSTDGLTIQEVVVRLAALVRTRERG